jgi:hypothetical protein
MIQVHLRDEWSVYTLFERYCLFGSTNMQVIALDPRM